MRALLLESALGRCHRGHCRPASRSAPSSPTPSSATFLLTGGRSAEVLGLELDDVSFDRRTITFRPNDWRRLKTRTSWRVVPLFPQLGEILRPYVFGPRLERGGRLLFPSFAGGTEPMLATCGS